MIISSCLNECRTKVKKQRQLKAGSIRNKNIWARVQQKYNKLPFANNEMNVYPDSILINQRLKSDYGGGNMLTHQPNDTKTMAKLLHGSDGKYWHAVLRVGLQILL
ncbi:hypothetical protein CDAR_67331 [Caerostris darwini]|uniref:Uncharacterized protein n=1 Tax=Caerostris darwini TaxID=1538125 RepID=A0AAV4WE84_9ARAC|nr:hypothetical protein CDAR_67331 [Caerostris darwini]